MLCSDHSLADIETFTLLVNFHYKQREVKLIKEGLTKDKININDPSAPQTSTLLAYRPQYDDFHDSGLAGLFVKIQDVFPCTQSVSNYEPVCSIFTSDDDGFRRGKRYVQAADVGNNMPVFGGDPVYALAVEGCPEMNTACLRTHVQIEIVCLLPCSSK